MIGCDIDNFHFPRIHLEGSEEEILKVFFFFVISNVSSFPTVWREGRVGGSGACNLHLGFSFILLDLVPRIQARVRALRTRLLLVTEQRHKSTLTR